MANVELRTGHPLPIRGKSFPESQPLRPGLLAVAHSLSLAISLHI